MKALIRKAVKSIETKYKVSEKDQNLMLHHHSCLLLVKELTLKAPVSTYKFSKLISIHFLKELVERI